MPRFLFSPRWIVFHIVVLLAVVGMVMAVFWQLDRLDQRKTSNEGIEQRSSQPAVGLDEILLPGVDPDDVANRPVVVSGTFLPDQIVLFNRSQNGRAVDNVITPLVLDDGRTVLVNRGAIAVGDTPPPPPAVEVRVLGRIRPSDVRSRGGLTDTEQETVSEVRRVDIAQIAPQLPGEVVPIYVELIATQPEVTIADPEPLLAPQLSEGNHLSYAVQWFIFALCVTIGWVLAVQRSLRSARAPSVPQPVNEVEPAE